MKKYYTIRPLSNKGRLSYNFEKEDDAKSYLKNLMGVKNFRKAGEAYQCLNKNGKIVAYFYVRYGI